MSTNKITVVHHSADFDGVFCREIARKFLPDAELIGWDFADKPLAIPEGKLYVLDLPVDRPFGLDFAKITTAAEASEVCQPLIKRVIWIDHHKSSIESHPPQFPGYRIDGVAACRLAWQYFTHPNYPTRLAPDGTPLLPLKEEYVARKVTEPLAVRLAGEYDIWDRRDPRAEVFQFGLRSRELTDFDWRQMLSTERPTIKEVERLIDVGHKGILEPDGTCVPAVVCGLLENGRILQTYQQRTDASVMGRSYLLQWEGLKFLALNTPRCNSLTFTAKDVPETGHDALLGFYFNGSKWTVSLYHARHRTDLDLSKIAVAHGGGGHKGACGFTSDNKPPFL